MCAISLPGRRRQELRKQPSAIWVRGAAAGSFLLEDVVLIVVLLLLLLLSLDASFPSLEHGRDQCGAAAGAVLGQHQVELVVDAHQLTDPGNKKAGDISKPLVAKSRLAHFYLDCMMFLKCGWYLKRDPSMAMTTSL